MMCYMDKTWCNAASCKRYHSCAKALPYAMCQQIKEYPASVGFRLPYAVRDKSRVCEEYEGKGK